MNSINVDIGGTFTDCFVYRENGLLHAKAPTTLYDLSVGFMQALGDAAEQVGLNWTNFWRVWRSFVTPLR